MVPYHIIMVWYGSMVLLVPYHTVAVVVVVPYHHHHVPAIHMNSSYAAYYNPIVLEEVRI